MQSVCGHLPIRWCQKRYQLKSPAWSLPPARAMPERVDVALLAELPVRPDDHRDVALEVAELPAAGLLRARAATAPRRPTRRCCSGRSRSRCRARGGARRRPPSSCGLRRVDRRPASSRDRTAASARSGRSAARRWRSRQRPGGRGVDRAVLEDRVRDERGEPGGGSRGRLSGGRRRLRRARPGRRGERSPRRRRRRRRA